MCLHACPAAPSHLQRQREAGGEAGGRQGALPRPGRRVENRKRRGLRHGPGHDAHHHCRPPFEQRICHGCSTAHQAGTTGAERRACRTPRPGAGERRVSGGGPWRPMGRMAQLEGTQRRVGSNIAAGGQKQQGRRGLSMRQDDQPCCSAHGGPPSSCRHRGEHLSAARGRQAAAPVLAQTLLAREQLQGVIFSPH